MVQRIIQFTVPGTPVAQPRQRHGVAKTKTGKIVSRNYLPKDHPVHGFKLAVQAAARLAYQGPPIDGPVSLEVVCVFARPKRLVWKKREMVREWMTSKPDADNLVKAVKDALNGLVWTDDARVCRMVVSKMFAGVGEREGVLVSVKGMD